MPKLTAIEIKTLAIEQSGELSDLLLSAPPEYSKYFMPFTFDRDTVTTVLSSARADRYFGIFINGKMAGFFMLRGFDQGYAIPAYGVWIAPRFAGKGLAELTLKQAIAVCRISGIDALMLKCHPKNIIARRLYERNGFVAVGKDEKNGNIIYHKNLPRSCNSQG